MVLYKRGQHRGEQHDGCSRVPSGVREKQPRVWQRCGPRGGSGHRHAAAGAVDSRHAQAAQAASPAPQLRCTARSTMCEPS
jgi:hypothetical protein